MFLLRYGHRAGSSRLLHCPLQLQRMLGLATRPSALSDTRPFDNRAFSGTTTLCKASGLNATQANVSVVAEATTQNTSPFSCRACDRVFDSQHNLDAHLGGKAHAKKTGEATTQNTTPFSCRACDRFFINQHNLDAHLAGKAHAKKTAWVFGNSASAQGSSSPLDLYFTSYTGFAYDRTKSPDASFRALLAAKGWKRKSPIAKEALDKYNEALYAEIMLWFGLDSDIVALHNLCKAVGIRSPPSTVKECKEAIRDTHVNIVDLIGWARAGFSDRPIRKFKTRAALAEYSRHHGRYFPKDNVKDDDGNRNVVIRHLLRRIF